MTPSSNGSNRRGAWSSAFVVVAAALASCTASRDGSPEPRARTYAATTPVVSAEAVLTGPLSGGTYSDCPDVASDGTNFVVLCAKEKGLYTDGIRAADGTYGSGRLACEVPADVPGPYGMLYSYSVSNVRLSASKNDYRVALTETRQEFPGIFSSRVLTRRVYPTGSPADFLATHLTARSPDWHFYTTSTASDGTSHVVGHQDYFSQTNSVVAITGRELALNGTISSPFDIQPGAVGTPPFALAAAGLGYLSAGVDRCTLTLRIFRPGGAAQTTTHAFSAPSGTTCRISGLVGGPSFLLTWKETATAVVTRVSRIDASGKLLDPAGIVGALPAEAAAFDGQSFVLVAPQTQAGTGLTALVAQRISPTGVVIDPTPFNVTPWASRSTASYAPKIAGTTSGVTAVVYTNASGRPAFRLMREASSSSDGGTGTHDAAPAKPDAAPAKPDATPVKPDAAPTKPDATPVKPDAGPAKPDSTVTTFDAAPMKLDAAPPRTDARASTSDAAPRTDARGSADAGTASSGGGCSVGSASSSDAPATSLGLLLALGLLVPRRSRKGRR